MQVTTSIIGENLVASKSAAILAEARGYDGLTTQENAHDPFLPLAVAALETSHVSLTTSIALAFTRSPVAVAYAAHDLHAASGGRFILGLGTQVKGHNERRFGVAWSAPAPRMAEYVRLVRAVWRCWEDGTPLDFDGAHYRADLMPPNFKPAPLGHGMLPIEVAAVGPAMLRLAGRHCDGVLLHPFCTRAYAENVVLPELEKGWADSGIARRRFRISGGGFVATGPDDEAVAGQIENVRRRVAFYGSTRTYHGVLAEHGLEDLGARLHAMSRAGDWDAMPAEIDDDTVRLFAAVGRHDEIADAIEARFGGVADTIGETRPVTDPPSLPPDLIADLKRLPCTFRGFDARR